MTIPDKGTFKRLSAAGLLGNTFQQWDTLAALQASGYDGHVTVRCHVAWNAGLFIPAVPAACLYAAGEAEEFLCVAHQGYGDYSARLADVYFQECPSPETQRVANLEVMYAEKGLYVRYALNDPLNLRHSLDQNGKEAEGLTALLLMRHCLQEDMDALEAIWDLYPDAIIEASVFTRAVGVQKSKLIIWEVRNY